MTRARRSLPLLLLAAALIPVPAAAAQAPVTQTPIGDDPEALTAEGVRLRKLHDNAGALSFFQRAYQLAPSPRAAAQLGTCEMAVGLFVEAEAHLAEALRASDDPWVNANRQTIYNALVGTKDYLGMLEVLGRPAGAEVEVDGRTVGRLPLPRPLRMVSGRDVYVRITAPGYEPIRRAVRIQQRELTRVVMELDPLPGTAVVAVPGQPALPPGGQFPMPAQGPGLDTDLLRSPPPPRTGTWIRPMGWVSAGVAAVLTGGGTYLLLRSNDTIREFNDVQNAPNTPDGRCSRTSAQAGGGACKGLLDDGERDRRLAVGAYVGAGVAAAAALAFFASAPDETSYALRCSPTLALGATCGWRF